MTISAYYDQLQLFSCRICGCTNDDCRQCVQRTGKPCSWVPGDDLCTACVPFVRVRLFRFTDAYGVEHVVDERELPF